MYPDDPPDFIFGPADNDFVPPLEEISVKIIDFSFLLSVLSYCLRTTILIVEKAIDTKMLRVILIYVNCFGFFFIV